jgi:glycosyltransferase involved in cell wall biosynthesis
VTLFPYTTLFRSDDVSALVSASDIFVLPSHFEAVSMVMLEAMLLGVPIISNDIPSGREFLGEDGVLADAAFPEKWLAAIRMLLARPEMVSEMTARAKTKAQRFTVPRMADAYEELIVPMEPRYLARSLDGIQ